MSTILITGGTGLVGSELTEKLLSRGNEIIILSREKTVSRIKGLDYARWSVRAKSIDKDALLRADYIIHLAGAGIADKRWSKKRKKEIRDSRVESSMLIATSLSQIKHKVKAVVSASAIGWYGPDKNGEPFIETDPPAGDFLGETCRQWEDGADRIGDAGPRVVKLRTGIVLSRKGGALRKFLKPMRFGIAPVMGNGRQIMSWIHIDDLVDLYIHSLDSEVMKGSYNAVSPDPVSNKNFINTISGTRKTLTIPVNIPAPILKLVLGEMSIEVLKSCTVSAGKTLGTGFQFKYPDVNIAVNKLINPLQVQHDPGATRS